MYVFGVVRGSIGILVLRIYQCIQAGRLCTRGLDPELRQYASSVPCPCGLTMVYKIVHPLKLGKSRYRLY